MDGKIEEIEIAFVGEESVGKTSIISRFEYDVFQEDLSRTAFVSYSGKIVKFTNGQEIKIRNLDFTGNEKYKSYLESTIKNSKAIVLVYCLDIFHYNLKDLQKYWIDEIKAKAPENSIIALVLNKNDSLGENVIPNESEGKKMAEDNGILFFSTSAKGNNGITELYEGIIKKIKGWEKDDDIKLVVEKEEDNEEEQNIVDDVDPKSNKKEEKRKCCSCF